MSSSIVNDGVNNLLEKMTTFVLSKKERPVHAAAIMGPNGSGKTRFLRSLQSTCVHKKKLTLFISAFRNIQSPQIEQYTYSQSTPIPSDFSTLNELIKFIIYKLFAPLPSGRAALNTGLNPLSFETAINVMVAAVLRRDAAIDSENDAAIVKWNRTSRASGEQPPQDMPLIWPDLKKLLDDIFEYDFFVTTSAQPGPSVNELKYNLNGKVLSLNDLSGGERQILLMSVLLMSDTSEEYVVIVDEPELHLNEQKAIEVWRKVEQKLSSSKFVYATHNVAFATRSEIETLHLMRLDGTIEWMALDEPLPSYALKEIVGSRIQLLRTELPVVFCEDELSKAIISDLFTEFDFAFIAVGGKDAVIRGARPDDIWNSLIAGDRKCCGIVDRDARQDNQVERLKEKGTFCLPFNEIESILIHPSVIIPLIRSIAPQRAITESDYVKLVCASAHSELLKSLDTLQGYIVDQTRIKIHHNRTATTIEVSEIAGLETIKDNFSHHANGLLKAIQANQVNEVLSLSCGKETYGRIARDSIAKIGVSIDPDALSFYRMIRDKDTVRQTIRSLPNIGALVQDVISRIGS